MNDFVLSVGGASPPTTSSSASRSSSAKTPPGNTFADLLQAKSSSPVSIEPRSGTDQVKPKEEAFDKERLEEDRPKAEPAQSAPLESKQQEQPAAVMIQPPVNQPNQDTPTEETNPDAELTVSAEGSSNTQNTPTQVVAAEAEKNPEAVQTVQAETQSVADLKAAKADLQAVESGDENQDAGKLAESVDFAAELAKAAEPVKESEKGIDPKKNDVDVAPAPKNALEGQPTAAAAAGKNSVQSQSMSTLKASISGISNEQVMQAASNEGGAPEVSAAPPKVDTTSLPLAGIETAKTVLQGEISEPARLAEAHSTEMLHQVMQGIETLVKGRNVQLKMSLHPDELGKIELRLTSGPNGVGVSIKAEQGDTSRLLESQLANLQQALTSAGINLTYVNIGQDARQMYQDASDGMPAHHAKALTNSAEKDYTSSALNVSSLRNHSATGVDYRI